MLRKMGIPMVSRPSPDIRRGDFRVAIVADAGGSGDQVFARLAEAGFDLMDARSAATGALSDRTRTLAGAWAVIAGGEPYDGSLLHGLRSLRVIARFGSGFDAIDVAAATRAGVAVTVARDANSESVADYTIGLMLSVVRRIVIADRLVRTGAWQQDAPTGDLTGSRVLIIGLGSIGKAVARRLAAFGCKLMAVDPIPDRDFCERYNIALVDLADGLARADVVSVHAPLTAETRRLVGARELALMSRTSVLVNTSRGDVVDQAALVDALRSGRIGGAGLDVFASEPLAVDDPLTSLDNVVLSGHVASTSRDAYANLIDAVEEALLRAAAGEIPATCVTRRPIAIAERLRRTPRQGAECIPKRRGLWCPGPRLTECLWRMARWQRCGSTRLVSCSRRRRGVTVMVDGYLSDALSQTHGIRRAVPAPLDLADIQPDVVMASHWHEDHLDPGLVARLPAMSETTFIGPPSCVSRVRGRGVTPDRSIALRHGQSWKRGDLTITATFARHEFEGFLTEDACGFLLQVGGLRVYHSGDTEYDARLLPLSEEPPDYSMICMNGTNGNMNAFEAALLAWELGTGVAVPMHFGLWRDEDYGARPTLDPSLFVDTYGRLSGQDRTIVPEPGRLIELRAQSGSAHVG